MRTPFNGSFPINQRFNDSCCRATYQQAFGMTGHNGIDYGLPAWTPVVAAHSGNIVSGWDQGGYGNYIFITGGGYESVYGHLARISRGSGAVQEGELIGYSGNMGFSSGAHLHWGVRPIPYNRNNGFFGYIDPLPLIEDIDMEEIGKLYKLLDQTNKRLDQLTPVLAEIAKLYKLLNETNIRLDNLEKR